MRNLMHTHTSEQTTTPSLDAQHEAAMRVLLQFRMVFGAVRSHFQKVEQAVGLGGAQVWALSVIAGTPGIGPAAFRGC